MSTDYIIYFHYGLLNYSVYVLVLTPSLYNIRYLYWDRGKIHHRVCVSLSVSLSVFVRERRQECVMETNCGEKEKISPGFVGESAGAQENEEILRKRISGHPLFGLLIENHLNCLKVSLSDFNCLSSFFFFC